MNKGKCKRGTHKVVERKNHIGQPFKTCAECGIVEVYNISKKEELATSNA